MPEIQGSFQSLPWPVQRQMILDMQRKAQARQQAGPALYGMFPEGQQPQAQPPAIQAPPPGAMSPGGGNPAVTGGAQPQPQPQVQPGPMMQRPPMQAPPQAAAPAAPASMQRPQMPRIAPFRPLPSAPQGEPQAPGADGIPPPPSSGGAPEAKPFDIKALVMGLRKQGIPGEKVMDMLDELAPVMNTQNRQELDALRVQNTALKEATAAYARVMQAQAANTRAETGVNAEQRRREQGDERNKIARERLSKQVGGEDKIVRWETDDAGNVIGGRTRTGKRIALDDPQTDRKGKGGQQAATRNKLVTGSAQNALRMLGDIKKQYPNDTTSILMTTHPEGLLESAATGVIRGTQGKRQQNVDTAWKSFIDEAIPVFTGGLRGSDAFRRFLTSQVPLMGAKNNAEIMDLFEKNIKGIDRTFANQMLTAYASDKKYWGTRADGSPVTQADVDAALEAAQGGGQAQGAPKDGDEQTSKSGRPMVRRNGRWEYK